MGEGVEDIEVALLGVGIDPHGASVMVLGEPAGGRALPIWIGSSEAQAIGILAGPFRAPRPLPHQLLVNVTTALAHHVVEVSIAGLREGVFEAEIVLSNGGRVDARPSDAVPVALAAAVPIRVAAEVLDAAGVPMPDLGGGELADPTPGSAAGSSAEIEAQARQLRRWLEGATAEDFGSDPPEHPPPGQR